MRLVHFSYATCFVLALFHKTLLEGSGIKVFHLRISFKILDSILQIALVQC